MIRCTPPQLPGQAHIPLRRTSPPFPARNPPSPWFQLRASSSEVAETAALAARDGFSESRSRSRPDVPLFDATREMGVRGLSGDIWQAVQAARTRMDAASRSSLCASEAISTAKRLSSHPSRTGLGLSCASWLARHFFVYGPRASLSSSSRAATSVSAWQTCTPPRRMGPRQGHEGMREARNVQGYVAMAVMSPGGGISRGPAAGIARHTPGFPCTW